MRSIATFVCLVASAACAGNTDSVASTKGAGGESAGGGAGGGGGTGAGGGAGGVAANAGQGSSGSGGTVSAAGGTVGGATTSGGKGGIAGSGGAGGSSGKSTGGGGGAPGPPNSPPPQWADASDPLGCGIEGITNALVASPIYSWVACKSGPASCLELALAKAVVTADADIRATVDDDGTDVWITLVLLDASLPTETVLVTRIDGAVVAGLRVADGNVCGLDVGSRTGASRFAIPISLYKGMGEAAAKVAVALGPTTPGAAVTMSPTIPAFYSIYDPAPIGNRVVLRMGGGLLFSINAIDGTGKVDLTKPPSAGSDRVSPAGSLAIVASNTDEFSITDGTSAPVLLAGGTGEGLWDAQSTGDALMWIKGYGSFGGWYKAEVWSSPFATDMASLAPTKVATLPTNQPGRAVGGHGFYAMPDGWGGGWKAVHVYRGSDGQHRRLDIPSDLRVNWVAGISATDLFYIVSHPANAAGDPGNGFTMQRVPLEAIPVVK